MKKNRRLAWNAACWILVFSVSVSGRDPIDRSLPEVPKISEKIVIDGRFDEPAWEKAVEMELEYETDPGENIPALVKTTVWMFHDRHCLYFGLKCFDPDPSKIRSRYSIRDEIDADDLININLDTFNDERRNFFFGCNPLGVQRDGVETVGGNLSWDAIWESAGRIDAEGYSIEIAIPFSSLQFQRTSGPQTWGLDISRWYPRSQRHRLGLVKIDRNNNSYQSQFLKIRGFAGIKPGKHVEIVPTLTGIKSDAREEFPSGDYSPVSQKLDPGLTVQWGMTPNLNLNGTLNPDFSQVEADARQLDINQPFALFYQEKRPFFTEGGDFFTTPFNAVYTRTLRDPLWGFKLSGKEGANTIGAYFVRDGLTNLIFPGSQGSQSASVGTPSSGLVLRYKRDFGNQYTLGALLTSRQGDDYFNRVFGIDGEARFTNRNRFSFQFLGSSTRYPGGLADEYSQPVKTLNDRAFCLAYNYQSRNFNAYVNYTDVGSRFRADLGFMPRVDFRQVNSGLNYSWIRSQGWWSLIQAGYQFSYSEDQQSRLLFRENSLFFFFRGALQSFFQGGVDHAREIYADRIFDQLSAGMFLMFQPSADLQVRINAACGDRIDYANVRPGNRFQINPSLNFNLGRHLTFALDHNFERMSVDTVRLYTANITQGMAVFHLNTRIFFRVIGQYVDYNYNVDHYTFPVDPEFRQFFSQFLFSYKLNPRTVLFLGYSDNARGTQDYSLIRSDRTLFLKLSYSWQF